MGGHDYMAMVVCRIIRMSGPVLWKDVTTLHKGRRKPLRVRDKGILCLRMIMVRRLRTIVITCIREEI